MDSKTLILRKALQKFAKDSRNHGRSIDFLGFAPLYHMPSTSYVVQVHAEWIDTMRSNEALKILIRQLYESVSPDIIQMINRIDICYSSGEVRCTAGNTLINKRKFELLSTPYIFIEE